MSVTQTSASRGWVYEQYCDSGVRPAYTYERKSIRVVAHNSASRAVYLCTEYGVVSAMPSGALHPVMPRIISCVMEFNYFLTQEPIYALDCRTSIAREDTVPYR